MIYDEERQMYKAPEDSIYFASDEQPEQPDGFGLTQEDRDTLITKIRKHAATCHSYWDSLYELMETDWGLYSGEGQWTEEASAARRNRPKLTLNQLPKFVKRVVAQTKKEPPGIKLAPREEGDKLKADIATGLIRYIEDSSGSKYAYAHALECAVIGGLGWIKGTINDEGNKILIKKVKDPFQFMIDPDSEEADGSDANYFIAHTKKQDGKKKLDCYEYWFKDEDGTVKWAIIEGVEVKDYGTFPGTIIPIFPVYGEDISYRNKRVVKGVIRDLIDAQRTYNYIKSQEVETVALTPKSPVIAQEGSLDGYEDSWRKASKTPVDILYYRQKNDQGEEVSPPQFAQSNPSIQWAPQITQSAQQDMREISGIYDTNMGADDRMLSGTAIIAKQQAGESAEYTYTEHLMATLQQIGRWVLQMVEPIMGDQHVIRILGEDGKQESINLDQPQIDPQTGAPVTLDLNFDELDISVSSAPAYATQREAGAQAIQDIMTAIPSSAQYIADIALRNLDVPGAQEAANRLKKMLPTELQGDDTEPGMVPEQVVEQIMQQSEQTIQEQQAIIEQMKTQMVALSMELQNQTQAKLATEQIKSQTQIAVAQIKEAGADQRKIADIEADTEADNKQIIFDAQKANQSFALEVAKMQKPETPKGPNTVSISTTTVNPQVTPTRAPEPMVFKQPIGEQ